MLLPVFVHSTKRNPVTNIKVRNIFELQLWDIHSVNQIFTARTLLLFSVHGFQSMIITTSALSVIKPCRLANIARTFTSVTSQLIVNSYFNVKVISKHSSNYDTFCMNVIICIFIYVYFIR